MKTSTPLNQTALWSFSCYLTVCVCVKEKGSVRERERECTQQIDFLWPHNQFIYLLHYSALMSFSVPRRVRTFKGNFDKNPLPTPTADICSWYICSFLVFIRFHTSAVSCLTGSRYLPSLIYISSHHPLLIFLPPNVQTYGNASYIFFIYTKSSNWMEIFCINAYRVKSSSSSLFCRVCRG